MARRLVRWTLIIVFLIAAAGGVLAWQHYFAPWESTDDAQVDGHINPVSARIGGTVVKVHVTDNQLVEAGALLVEIDRRDYEIAVERARAELRNAQAEAAASRAQVPLATSSSGL